MRGIFSFANFPKKLSINQTPLKYTCLSSSEFRLIMWSRNSRKIINHTVHQSIINISPLFNFLNIWKLIMVRFKLLQHYFINTNLRTSSSILKFWQLPGSRHHSVCLWYIKCVMVQESWIYRWPGPGRGRGVRGQFSLFLFLIEENGSYQELFWNKKYCS